MVCQTCPYMDVACPSMVPSWEESVLAASQVPVGLGVGWVRLHCRCCHLVSAAPAAAAASAAWVAAWGSSCFDTVGHWCCHFHWEIWDHERSDHGHDPSHCFHSQYDCGFVAQNQNQHCPGPAGLKIQVHCRLNIMSIILPDDLQTLSSKPSFATYFGLLLANPLV